MVTKSANQIAEKWARVTPERLTDYEAGVRTPKRDWEKNTSDAEGRYEEGIKASIQRKAFGKGVKRAGTAHQQAMTIEKGMVRWPDGVRTAEARMATGMQRVVSVLEKTTLPPRYAKGDPRNLKRVEAVNIALHKMKIGT